MSETYLFTHHEAHAHASGLRMRVEPGADYRVRALLTHVEGASTASTAEARAWCVTRYQDAQAQLPLYIKK